MTHPQNFPDRPSRYTRQAPQPDVVNGAPLPADALRSLTAMLPILEYEATRAARWLRRRLGLPPARSR